MNKPFFKIVGSLKCRIIIFSLIYFLLLLQFGCNKQENKNYERLDFIYIINEFVSNIENNKYDSINVKNIENKNIFYKDFVPIIFINDSIVNNEMETFVNIEYNLYSGFYDKNILEISLVDDNNFCFKNYKYQNASLQNIINNYLDSIYNNNVFIIKNVVNSNKVYYEKKYLNSIFYLRTNFFNLKLLSPYQINFIEKSINLYHCKINEIRNKLSLDLFNKDFFNLNFMQKSEIIKLVPKVLVVFFETYGKCEIQLPDSI